MKVCGKCGDSIPKIVNFSVAISKNIPASSKAVWDKFSAKHGGCIQASVCAPKIPIAETLPRTQFAAAEAKEIANVRKSVAQGKRTVRKNLKKKQAKK